MRPNAFDFRKKKLKNPHFFYITPIGSGIGLQVINDINIWSRKTHFLNLLVRNAIHRFIQWAIFCHRGRHQMRIRFFFSSQWLLTATNEQLIISACHVGCDAAHEFRSIYCNSGGGDGSKKAQRERWVSDGQHSFAFDLFIQCMFSFDGLTALACICLITERVASVNTIFSGRQNITKKNKMRKSCFFFSLAPVCIPTFTNFYCGKKRGHWKWADGVGNIYNSCDEHAMTATVCVMRVEYFKFRFGMRVAQLAADTRTCPCLPNW